MLRLLLLIGVVFSPTLLRGQDVDNIIARVMEAPWFGTIEVLRNDYIVISCVLLLLLLTCVTQKRWLALTAFTGAVLIQLPLFADVLIRSQFYQRLVFADLVKFGGYAVDYILDFNIKFLIFLLVASVFGSGFLIYLYRWLRNVDLSGKTAAVFGVLLMSTGVFAWQTIETSYINYRFFQNVYAYNKTVATEYKNYSEEFAASLSDPFSETCVSRPKLSGPVVFLMVESLSSYQSKFFGGHEDWLPRLDEIAASNTAFTNFYATGYTTEDGELSLITSEYPIFPPKSVTRGKKSNFAGYWNPERSLPPAFEDAGYQTAFLTTSDLKFSSTGDWMTSVGFNIVEGSKGPFYEGHPRLTFDAAADEVLIDRLLEFVDTNEGDFLVFAKTVTSHHPHILPQTRERNEEAVFRYVDEQIGRFHQELEARDFFDDGHLIIVGDHRAMLPLSAEEIATYGMEKAFARIPVVIVSNSLKSQAEVVTDQFSQRDLSNSLIGAVSGQVCTNAVMGSFLPDAYVSPDFILHRRGDRRNQFSVFSRERLGTVTLNGDASSFDGDAFDPQDQARILQYINYKRFKAAEKFE